VANLVQNMRSGILKMIANSGFLTAPECTKFVFGRGSAPDPAGGAYDAPPVPLVGWGGGNPLPIPHPPRRLRRLVPDAFGVGVFVPPLSKVWLRHSLHQATLRQPIGEVVSTIVTAPSKRALCPPPPGEWGAFCS